MAGEFRGVSTIWLRSKPRCLADSAPNRFTSQAIVTFYAGENIHNYIGSLRKSTYQRLLSLKSPSVTKAEVLAVKMQTALFMVLRSD